MCDDGPRLRSKTRNGTLSALARPGKALALEAQIELWSAINRPVPLFSFPNDTNVVMSSHRTLVMLGQQIASTEDGAGCHGNVESQRPPAEGEIFVLTAPFIEHRTWDIPTFDIVRSTLKLAENVKCWDVPCTISNALVQQPNHALTN